MEEPISLELILLLLMLQTMFSNTFSFSMRQWIEASYFFKSFLPIFFFFFFLYLLNYWWSHFIKSTVVATNSSVRFPLSTTAQQLSLFVLHQVSFSMYIFKTWWSDNIHSHYNISIINGKKRNYIYPSEYLRNIRLSTHFPICFSIWY